MQTTITTASRRGPREALAGRWPEYLMEASELALFMISACVFAVLLEHPSSVLHQSIDSPLVRRLLMGSAMGLTAIGIIYSPLGQRSGGHFNPSVTLTYWLLGKVEPWDAAFYIAAQFLGGILGVLTAALLIGLPLSHSAVNHVVTVPGPGGAGAAFQAEALISFLLMLVVLQATNSRRLARFTPVFAGLLVAAYITLEAPFSGMSMNPARTFGSAFSAREWTALWVYFTAPPLGMILAGLFYRFRRGPHAVLCAKLHHNHQRCIFRCDYGKPKGRQSHAGQQSL
ncbi:MAG: aquaporin [Bryobacterales bacterium]|nr:aquaporin [Bryobacterales bacterium]